MWGDLEITAKAKQEPGTMIPNSCLLNAKKFIPQAFSGTTWEVVNLGIATKN